MTTGTHPDFHLFGLPAEKHEFPIASIKTAALDIQRDREAPRMGKTA